MADQSFLVFSSAKVRIKCTKTYNGVQKVRIRCANYENLYTPFFYLLFPMEWVIFDRKSQNNGGYLKKDVFLCFYFKNLTGVMPQEFQAR